MDPNRKFNLSELLKIAKANKDTFKSSVKATDKLDEVTQFVLTFKIKDGGNRVTAKVIYKAYQNWSIDPMTVAGFFQRFATLFESHVGNGNFRYYNLNYKPAQLLNAVERSRGRAHEPQE